MVKKIFFIGKPERKREKEKKQFTRHDERRKGLSYEQKLVFVLHSD